MMFTVERPLETPNNGGGFFLKMNHFEEVENLFAFLKGGR